MPTPDLAAFCHGLNDSYVAADSREDVPKAVLLSVGAGAGDLAEIAAEVAAEVGGELFIAMDNCPHQVVLVGDSDSVARAQELARGRGFVCETLPYDRAVHTPLFAPIADDLRAIFERLPVQAPAVPLWSCTSAGPHTDDPTEIRALLVEHWTSPVRFRETIEALHDDGFRVFIESGARGNLTSFVDDILRGRPSVAVPADLRRRSGTAQLCHLVATLAAHGVELNPGYLFEHRGIEPVDWRAAAAPAARKAGPKIPLSTAWPMIRLSPDDVAALPEQPPVAPHTLAASNGHHVPAASNGHDPDPATVASAPPALPVPAAAMPAAAAPASAEVELLPVAPVSIEADEAAIVVDGHLALMAQFLESGAEVMQSFLGQAVATEPPTMPLLGTIVSYDAGEALVAERVIDLDSDAYLRDHTLGRTVSRTDPSLTALAVMPLTMSLELMAEAAAALLPQLVVTGMRDVHAHRWLVVGEAPAMIEISAVRLDPEGDAGAEVQVVLGELNDAAELVPVIEGVVGLEASYATPPPATAHGAPAGARASRFAPDRLYQDAMFHGPIWRGVRSVDWVADSGAGATLAALPRDGMVSGEALPEFVLDPVLLDAAGQLIGFWTADQLERGHVVFPFRMAALDLFAPPPPAGEQFECRAQIELEGDHLVRSDIEVIGADGLCRMRLRGWADKRFDVPPAFAGLSSPASLRPLSSDWPAPAHATGAGRVACRRMGVELGADAGLWKQVWAGRVLGRRERELFGALTVPPRRQLEWLAARTAAKEAIVELVRELSGVELLPAEIEILRDERGAPIVVGLEVAGYVPVVSLTHSGGEAAAIALLVPAAEALGAGVGIDLERLARRPVGFAQAVLSDRERPLLAELPEEQMEEWQLRCWCAKEAAGKAAGTGLVPATAQAPRVVAVDLARESVQVEASGRRTLVPTRREGNLIVATTVAEEARTA